MTDIFLLTKPPKHQRAELCFRFLKRSRDASLYLCGDGVYCALDLLDDLLPPEKIVVCKEDMDARGGLAKVPETVITDFYEKLMKDMMISGNRVLAF
jgi:sulfur relay protein TusB/DsrH